MASMTPRPTPRRRPNPRLSNPECRGDIGRAGVVLLIACFVVIGVAAMLAIWASTCGMGAHC